MIDQKDRYVGLVIILVYAGLSRVHLYMVGRDISKWSALSIWGWVGMFVVGAIIGFVFGSGLDNIASGVLLAAGIILAFYRMRSIKVSRLP